MQENNFFIGIYKIKKENIIPDCPIKSIGSTSASLGASKCN